MPDQSSGVNWETARQAPMENVLSPPSGNPFLAFAHATVRVREALQKAACVDVRVLLYGEPGVGKTCAGRYLHARSVRSTKPLVCLSVRDRLALSKLGDATYVSSLEGGTLLLDGVDEAPGDVQAFLVAAIEDWGTSEVGDTPRVRVLSTASQDLLPLAESGLIRRDLYYLLDVFPLSIPPLRERFEEIISFMEHFHRKYAHGRAVPPIPDDFLQDAFVYSWPGNLRELENLTAASVAASGGEAWMLPRVLPRQGAEPDPTPFYQAKREFETSYVRRLLLLTAGNVTRAAGLAGKARKDFYALLARNGIQPSEFRR